MKYGNSRKRRKMKNNNIFGGLQLA